MNTLIEEVQVSRKRAAQDQQIAELATHIFQMIKQIENDPQISAIIAGAGYDEDGLQQGKNLCELVQKHFTRRQEALNQRKRLTDQLEAAEDELNKRFSDYRVIARALFNDSNDHQQLGVSGRRPGDRQKLLTTIDAAITIARKEPYLETFSRHGFDPAAFDILSQSAVSVSDLIIAQNNATRAAKETTRIRDEAAKELEAWAGSLRSIAKRLLREIPNAADVIKV